MLLDCVINDRNVIGANLNKTIFKFVLLSIADLKRKHHYCSLMLLLKVCYTFSAHFLFQNFHSPIIQYMDYNKITIKILCLFFGLLNFIRNLLHIYTQIYIYNNIYENRKIIGIRKYIHSLIVSGKYINHNLLNL